MPKILNLRKNSVQNPQPRTFRAEGFSQLPPEITAQKALDQNNSALPQISWEAPLFYYNPQKKYLYLIAAILMAGAAALLIFKYDTLTSIFLILSSLVLILYSRQKPVISKITVDQSGILVDDIIYRYKDLKSFWINYNPGGPKELSLESEKWYMPYIKIMLSERNPVEIRSLIVNFLPEKEHENSLGDHIGRKLGL